MVNDAQLNYAALELPMGGWKASGLGSRHGPDGIRKYTKRQSLMVTPGYAPSRDAASLPLQRPGQRGDRRDLRGARDQRSVRRPPAGDAGGALRHLHPLARAAGRRGRPARLLGALGLARERCPRAVEVALLGAELDRRAGRRACARCSTRWPRTGWPRRPPQEAREQIVHGFCEPSPEALAGIATLRGPRRDALLRAARPRHRAQPDLGRDRLSRAPSSAPRRARATARGCAAPRGAERDDRGRRLHRRLGRRRRRDRRRARGGGQVGGRARGRATTTTTRDFDQLELSAYQRLYLNGGPFPTADGQVSIVAGAGVGGGTVVNWTNCLRTHDWVREEWATRARARGPRRPGVRRATSTRSSSGSRSTTTAATSTARTSGCGRRCEQLGYDFRLITRNAEPRPVRPRERRLHGLRRPVGLQALDREDLPASTRRPTAPRSSPAPRPSGCWSRTDARPASRRRGPTPTRRPANGAGSATAHRARAGGRRRRGLDRVAGAAAALGHRRARGRRLPAPAPDGRGDRLLRRAPELDAGARRRPALSHQFADTRRRLRLPDRVRAGDHRPVRRRAAVALGRRPQAADARVGARRAADRPHPRAGPRPGRRSTRPATPSPTIRSPTRSTSATSAPAVEQLIRIHEAAGRARDRRQRHAARRTGRRGDDLEAFIATLNDLADRPARVRHSSRPTRWAAAGWAATRRLRSPTRGASSTTRPASGSATRARSRAPRAPTRWLTIMALARRTAHAIAAA